MSFPPGFDGPLRRQPEGLALRVGAEAWTWAALAARIAALGRALTRAGLRPGQRIVIPSRPVGRAALGVWAALAQGAHAVPLAPDLPRAERARRAAAVGAAFFLDDDGPRALLGSPAPARHAPGEGALLVGGAALFLDDDGPRALLGSPAPARHAPGEGALLVFTSGTTGPARAAVLDLPALIASADSVAAATGLGPGDAWLDPLPLSHIGGVGVLLRGARVGAASVLLERGSPEALSSALGEGPSHLSLVARMLDGLLSCPLPPHRLRQVLVGGGRADPGLLRRARAAGLPVVSTYGLSEAGSTVTLQRPDEPVGEDGDAGWPLPGRVLRVTSDGAIEVGGPTLMRGYHDGPPLGPWLETGDRGRLLPDGRLLVLDRRVDRIVTGGENVAPREVEDRLRAVEGVREVCVLGLPHPSWGQEVVAVVVWDGPPRVEALVEAARELAPWQRPRRWVHRSEGLPRSGLGKILRQELRGELGAG